MRKSVPDHERASLSVGEVILEAPAVVVRDAVTTVCAREGMLASMDMANTAEADRGIMMYSESCGTGFVLDGDVPSLDSLCWSCFEGLA